MKYINWISKEEIDELVERSENKWLEIKADMAQWERDGSFRDADPLELLSESGGGHRSATAPCGLAPMPPVSDAEIEGMPDWGIF